MNWRIFLAVFLLANAPALAYACVNPPGDAGDQVYNTTYNVMQYCNGTNWIAMGSHSASGDGLGDHTAGQALDMGGFRIQNLAPPTADNHAVTRAYVTSAIAAIPAPTTPNLSSVLATGNAAGNKKISGLAAPSNDADAATKKYVDDTVAGAGGGGSGLPACTEGQSLIMGTSSWLCRNPMALGCDGYEHEGACWVLAPYGTSCEAACSTRGGYNELTRTYAGSDGADHQCENILYHLATPFPGAGGIFGPSMDCTAEGIPGLGCFKVFMDPAESNVGFRCATPATDKDAVLVGEGLETLQRACACNSGPTL